MRDDFLTADWAAQHSHISDAIRRTMADIGDGFAKLQAHQFDAPWLHDTRASRSRIC